MRKLELAERVIELRERAKLTQAEASKKAGVGVTTWSNIETGTITRPHARTVIKMARALGVDPEDLTGPKAPTGDRSGDERLRDRLAPRIKRLERLDEGGLFAHRRELAEHLSELKTEVPFTNADGQSGWRQEITDYGTYLEIADELLAVMLVLERVAGRVRA